MNRWVHCLLEDARAAAEAARRRVDEDMQKAESKFGAVGTSRGARRASETTARIYAAKAEIRRSETRRLI